MSMRPSAHFWKPTEVLEFAGALRSGRELALEVWASAL